LTGNIRAASLPLVIHFARGPGLLSPDRSTCNGAAPVLWLVRSPERALGHRETPPREAPGGAGIAIARRRARTN